MPGPDLVTLFADSDAYAAGQTLGRAFRWVLLLAVGFVLVRRMGSLCTRQAVPTT